MTQGQSEKSDQRYYYAEIIHDPDRAKSLWIDLNSLPKHQVFKHDVLSESHRRAASIMLPFKFPFYGQNMTKATIATGGFLYMGDHIHSWLAATQYIAPLMAHFDTRNSSSSNILYGYNQSLFVIQWEKVNLLEKANSEFTFQCVLYRNGDIAFVYKDIPIPIQDISDVGHPVKIGVSDAYFIHRSQVCMFLFLSLFFYFLFMFFCTFTRPFSFSTCHLLPLISNSFFNLFLSFFFIFAVLLQFIQFWLLSSLLFLYTGNRRRSTRDDL